MKETKFYKVLTLDLLGSLGKKVRVDFVGSRHSICKGANVKANCSFKGDVITIRLFGPKK